MTKETGSSSNSKGKTIGIITAIVGGVTLLSVGGTAAVATALNLDSASVQSRSGQIVPGLSGPGQVEDSNSQQHTLADLEGLTSVYVDTSAADFELKFADVEQAELETSGTSGREWGLEREGTVLVAETKEKFWFGFGFCFFWCDWQTQTVTLTLPAELDGKLDAELNLGAGSMTATGDFQALKLDVSAGSAKAVGAAETVIVALSAGEADLQFANVNGATFEVSAGKMVANLTGTAPQEIEAEVSAGGLDLTVPDVVYNLSSELAAGSLDNDLRTDPSSQNRISVEVAAGSVKLQRGIG